jgi:hypothetical protein
MRNKRLEQEAAKVDWSRLHDLLDIKAEREFDAMEQADYDTIKRIVDQLDAEEARIGNAAVDRLTDKHRERLRGLLRLAASLLRRMW